MTRYNPDKHYRRSTRPKGYKYTQPGAYFITIVTHGRELLFDDPIFRRVAETIWQRIPRHFPHAELGEWLVMPNHIHGIIVIVDESHGRGDAFPVSRPVDQAIVSSKVSVIAKTASEECVAPTGPPSGSLGAIIGNFRSVTARRINRIHKTPGAPVWQRNYYERIIRNERELNAVRQYIRDNPASWAEDMENPECRGDAFHG